MKWSFDGHGINDENGARVCKVQHLQPYTDGNKRNAEFDRISNLIACAPEMLEALKAYVEDVSKDSDGNERTMSIMDWHWLKKFNAIIARIEEE